MPSSRRSARPTRATPRRVIDALQQAAQGCLRRRFDGLVTGPVHKAVINDGGIAYSGTTELLAQQAGREVVMMLANDIVRVALVTTHLPLRAVADAISARGADAHACASLTPRCATISASRDPVIAVLGLNPHAGEAGHLGREELEVIEPTLAALRAQGLHLVGPLPADTAFLPAKLRGFDAVVAMYHDQGLPVLKYSGFERAVNLTLGLPYPRVAVDHGTALELAGQGVADPSSLFAAADTCARIARIRRTLRRMSTRHFTEPPNHPRKAFPPRRKSTSASTSCTNAGSSTRSCWRWTRKPGDRLVEIGPGQGAITFPLLDRHGELTVIEFDRDLIFPLTEAARAHGTLEVIHRDVLQRGLQRASPRDSREQIRLVGNLPYNLSSPILFHALDHAAAIRDMVFMLQKEVVDRMAAGPGSKVYGRLSVMLQAYCHGHAAVRRPAGRVPAAAEGRFGRGAAGAARAGDDRHRRSRRCSPRSCATPSASAARPCATRCPSCATPTRSRPPACARTRAPSRSKWRISCAWPIR